LWLLLKLFSSFFFFKKTKNDIGVDKKYKSGDAPLD